MRSRIFALVLISVVLSPSHASAVSCAQVGTVSSHTTAKDDTTRRPSYGEAIDFILANITQEVRKEFKTAWEISKTGTSTAEGLALLYRAPDGSLFAKAQIPTNENRRVSFKWAAGIVAIVHTHPNSHAAEPSAVDLELSDRFQVPIFTITNRGMFAYNPYTRRISRVVKNVRWLPSKRSRPLRVERAEVRLNIHN